MNYKHSDGLECFAFLAVFTSFDIVSTCMNPWLSNRNNGNVCNQQLSASLFSTVNSHLKLRLVFLAHTHPLPPSKNNKQTNKPHESQNFIASPPCLYFYFFCDFHCLSLTASEITTTFSPVLSCDVTILLFDLLSIDQLSPGINDSELNCLCLPGWCKVW